MDILAHDREGFLFALHAQGLFEGLEKQHKLSHEASNNEDSGLLIAVTHIKDSHLCVILSLMSCLDRTKKKLLQRTDSLDFTKSLSSVPPTSLGVQGLLLGSVGFFLDSLSTEHLILNGLLVLRSLLAGAVMDNLIKLSMTLIASMEVLFHLSVEGRKQFSIQIVFKFAP